MDHLKIIIKFTVPKVTGVKYDSFIKYENMCHRENTTKLGPEII